MEQADVKRAANIIRTNIDLISKNKFDILFANCAIASNSRAVIGAMGYLLHEAGIPFIEIMGYVPKYAFYETDIKSITIPQNCMAIEDYAFFGCTRLKTVRIETAPTYISDFAFSNNYSLDNIYFSGTSEEWEQIDIAVTARNKGRRTIVQCADRSIFLRT